MGLPTITLKSAISYVAAAYIGIWVVFFVYLYVVSNRLSSLRRQVEALSEAVAKKPPGQ